METYRFTVGSGGHESCVKRHSCSVDISGRPTCCNAKQNCKVGDKRKQGR